jgi:hypothetical protein
MSRPDGRARSPWGVVGLTIVTLGVYWLVWSHRINRELQVVARRSWPVGRRVSEIAALVVISWAATAIGGATGDFALLLRSDVQRLGPFLLVAYGCLLAAAILGVVVEFRTVETIRSAQRASGLAGVNVVPMFLLMLALPLVGLWFAQDEINKVWRARSSGRPTPGVPST